MWRHRLSPGVKLYFSLRTSQILGAYIIILIRLSSGDLANSSSKSELLSVHMYTMPFESTLNFDHIETTVTPKS